MAELRLCHLKHINLYTSKLSLLNELFGIFNNNIERSNQNYSMGNRRFK